MIAPGRSSGQCRSARRGAFLISRGVVPAWRLTLMLAHLTQGLALVVVRFPSLDAASRHAHIQRWSTTLLRRLGVEIRVHGGPRRGATLLVANHVSWLDITALHAAAPQARFVSKADVRGWPLVGPLVAAAGTLFIERENRRDALRVVHQMAEALRAGETVAVFPEGTTGPGRELLPFHANLLQAAIATAAAVQPVVLRFHDAEHAFSPAAQFVGETTLMQSLWRVACAEKLAVEVRFLPALVGAHADRRALAAALHEAIAETLARQPPDVSIAPMAAKL